VLRNVFGPLREAATEGWKKYVMRNLIICIANQILLVKEDEILVDGGTCSTSVYGGEEKCVQGCGEETRQKEPT
jgi:hypothetical protein